MTLAMLDPEPGRGLLPPATVRRTHPERNLSRPLACGLLLLAAFFWGAGNVANKTVLEHVDPYTTVALRCLLAALVILPFLRSETLRHPAPGFLSSAIGVASLFAAGLVLQQVAYQNTTVTNASFLVNIASILTPLIAWCVLGHLPGLRIIIAGVVTVAGAALMSGYVPGSTAMNRGDLTCLASALFYAGWMVALGHHAIRHGRPFATSLVQFLATALILLPVIALTQSPTLGAVRTALPELLILGVFSTAAAFVLQTVSQRHVTASTAAVLVSAESLFGAAGAFVLLDERLSLTGTLGAALILVAILLVAAASGRTPGAWPPRRSSGTTNHAVTLPFHATAFCRGAAGRPDARRDPEWDWPDRDR